MKLRPDDRERIAFMAGMICTQIEMLYVDPQDTRRKRDLLALYRAIQEIGKYNHAVDPFDVLEATFTMEGMSWRMSNSLRAHVVRFQHGPIPAVEVVVGFQNMLEDIAILVEDLRSGVGLGPTAWEPPGVLGPS